jgi:hypothetical protein
MSTDITLYPTIHKNLAFRLETIVTDLEKKIKPKNINHNICVSIIILQQEPKFLFQMSNIENHDNDAISQWVLEIHNNTYGMRIQFMNYIQSLSIGFDTQSKYFTLQCSDTVSNTTIYYHVTMKDTLCLKKRTTETWRASNILDKIAGGVLRDVNESEFAFEYGHNWGDDTLRDTIVSGTSFLASRTTKTLRRWHCVGKIHITSSNPDSPECDNNSVITINMDRELVDARSLVSLENIHRVAIGPFECVWIHPTHGPLRGCFSEWDPDPELYFVFYPLHQPDFGGWCRSQQLDTTSWRGFHDMRHIQYGACQDKTFTESNYLNGMIIAQYHRVVSFMMGEMAHRARHPTLFNGDVYVKIWTELDALFALELRYNAQHPWFSGSRPSRDDILLLFPVLPMGNLVNIDGKPVWWTHEFKKIQDIESVQHIKHGIAQIKCPYKRTQRTRVQNNVAYFE